MNIKYNNLTYTFHNSCIECEYIKYVVINYDKNIKYDLLDTLMY